MITKETHSLGWITSLRNRLGTRTDPKLIEKVVYALCLLEQLRIHEIQLIFKGGTSILLATEKPTRFSIDIDIITEHTEDEIIVVLEKIVAIDLFIDWKPDNDRKHVIEAPIGHYKLYYISVVDGKTEPILLDVLYTANPYPATKKIPIAHAWLNQEDEPITVEVPTFDSILGDKLTAFAPKTTGILYSKNRPVEIIKQLYDVAFLFDNMENIKTARNSFMEVVKEEIAFRKLNIEWHQVLDDIENTCYLLVERDQTSKQFLHLQTGIRNLTNFIIGRFNIEEAITAGAKVAYFSALLRNENPTLPSRYNGPNEITDWVIDQSSKPRLNKLKKSNPEAFFYWYKTYKL